MEDTVHAFVSTFRIDGRAEGRLHGRSFAAKDLYDVAGHKTGCGNPDWEASHEVAQKTAPAVQCLLDAGAPLVGKTHTDELAYSLMGVNAHYGTPINPAAPDRVPGGSSSGSASATAAGLIDIGLGSDTGGSVRLPASFCGLFGIRTTHGRLDLANAMPFAPSFDTVGWFARDGETFAEVGRAFGYSETKDSPAVRLLVAEDAMICATPETRAILSKSVNALKPFFDVTHSIDMSGNRLAEWRKTFQVCQAAEVWQTLGPWVTKTQPHFGPGIKERFSLASQITQEQKVTERAKRHDIAEHLSQVLGDDGIIVLPTGPGPAPFRDASESSLDVFRTSALELLCAAGLAGLPQVSLPIGTVDGAPVGLSLIASRQKDEWLLTLAQKVADFCPELA